MTRNALLSSLNVLMMMIVELNRFDEFTMLETGQEGKKEEREQDRKRREKKRRKEGRKKKK
jgi:hypothetical protein